MKKIEVSVESITVKKNGNRRNRPGSPEDLVLIAQWDDPNYIQESISGAIDLDDVKNDDPWTQSSHARLENENLDRLATRIFKTTVDGSSVIRFTLVRRKELSALGKIFAKLINAAAVFGAGTLTGGVGAVLAKTAAGHLVSIPDKWNDILGESTYFISEDATDGDKIIEIGLLLSPQAKAALKRIYAIADYDRRTRRRGPPELPDDVREVIDSGENGSIQLRIREV